MKNSSSQIPQQQCPRSLEGAMSYEVEHGGLDLMKIRRSRIKRGIYVRDLETMVKDLEVAVSILTSQLEIYKKNNKLLQLQNDSLRPQLEKRSDESKRMEVDIEEKRASIKMLKIEDEKGAQKNKQLASVYKEKEIPYFGFEPYNVAPYPNVKLEPDSLVEQSSTGNIHSRL